TTRISTCEKRVSNTGRSCPVLPGVALDLGGLDPSPDGVSSMQPELGQGGRADVGGQGRWTLQVDPDLVPVALYAVDEQAPYVAWAAVRALWVQGDRARRKGNQGRSRVRFLLLVSDRPVGPVLLQYHRGALGTPTKEVEPLQPSHIGGPGSTGHLGGCALLVHTT